MKQNPDNQPLPNLRQIQAEIIRVEAEIAALKAQINYLERGAEPFWMQDVRLRQRLIDAQREASRERPGQSTSASENEVGDL